MKPREQERIITERKEAEALLALIRSDARLTEEEFVTKCLSGLMRGWIPLAEYTRLYPSETANKVHKRVQQGTWQRQIHYAAPEGGVAWVNLPAIRLWIEGLLSTSSEVEG